MKLELSPPDLAAIAITRGIAGIGIGLLLSRVLSYDTRQSLGWTLLGIGALSTLPIGYRLYSKHRLIQG